MSDTRQSDSPGGGDQLGKTRTWWHPLLARLLDFVLGPAFAVSEELSVGKVPLRVDILLIRREIGQLPETSQRDLSPLVPLLNRYTLIEFKAPPDAIERGDAAHLLGCCYLWLSRQSESIPW